MTCTTPPVTTATVLQAIKVSRRFGEVRALTDVSIAVDRGQLFGLVGPDGAGKTTLIRALAGLIGVDGGSVEVFGADPLKNASLRDAMGVMPQHYSLYGDLSVEENLHFFANLYCLPRKTYRTRVARLLTLTRLEPFTDRRVAALSGGMYKKLALACALLHEPDVLLLDEPTNGVDPVSRRELWQLLHEFVSNQMAVLISTAYMDEAARCHQVCLLHHGRVLAEGAPQHLIKELKTPVFEIDGQDREALRALLENTNGIIAASPAGARLRVVVEPSAVEPLTVALRPFGATLNAVAADFEDVFLARIHGDELKSETHQEPSPTAAAS